MSIKFVAIWLLFHVWGFYGHEGCEILAPQAQPHRAVAGGGGGHRAYRVHEREADDERGNQTHNPFIGRQSLNHWTARKVPRDLLFNFYSRTGVGILQPVGPVQQAASSLKDCVWLLLCYSSRVEL